MYIFLLPNLRARTQWLSIKGFFPENIWTLWRLTSSIFAHHNVGSYADQLLLLQILIFPLILLYDISPSVNYTYRYNVVQSLARVAIVHRALLPHAGHHVDRIRISFWGKWRKENRGKRISTNIRTYVCIYINTHTRTYTYTYLHTYIGGRVLSNGTRRVWVFIFCREILDQRRKSFPGPGGWGARRLYCVWNLQGCNDIFCCLLRGNRSGKCRNFDGKLCESPGWERWGAGVETQKNVRGEIGG